MIVRGLISNMIDFQVFVSFVALLATPINFAKSFSSFRINL